MGRLSLFGLVIVLIMVAPSHAQKKLVFGSAGPMHPYKYVVKLILEEAYSQIGYQIEIEQFPPARSLYKADQGDVDGELFKGSHAKVEEHYRNLIKVPVVLTYGEFSVFTKGVIFEVDGWESLRPYEIGIQLGVKGIERGTQGMLTRTVAETPQLLMMLAQGRVDVAVLPRLVGLMHLDDLRASSEVALDFWSINVLEPPVKQDALYHYLHTKNEFLIPQLTEVLQKMHMNGEIKRIVDGLSYGGYQSELLFSNETQ